MKNRLKQIHIPNFKIKTGNAKEGPSTLLWVVLSVVLAVYFLTTHYVDNPVIFLTAYWDNVSIIENSPWSIFSTPTLPYGLLHRFICQIWVLPINLLHEVFGMNFDGMGAFLWYKTLPILFLLCDTYILGMLAKQCGLSNEKEKWLQFFSISSLFVALPVFHIAQTDVIYLFFVLLGIYYYLKGNHWRFILCFALAIPMKYLPVFVLIPLVLLREKRILYIMRDCLLGISGVICEKIICKIGDVLYYAAIAKNNIEAAVTSVAASGRAEEAADTVTTYADSKGNFISHFINKTLYFEFPAVRKGMMASVLLLLFFLLCIWCYMQKKENEQEWNQICVYTVAASLSIYFFLGTPTPYWIVILIPFLLLLLFMNERCLRINLILELLFTLTMFYIFIIDTPWVYGGSVTFDYLLLEVFGIVKEKHVYDEGPCVGGYFEKFGLDQFGLYATSAVLACVIGILLLNYFKNKRDEQLSEQEKEKYLHGFAITRVAILVIWYLANLVMVANII